MGTLNEELTQLETVEGTVTRNKVSRFAYTQEAYDQNDADGVDVYNINNAQNIPNGTPTVMRVNDTVVSKGYRAQASSITRMLMNHFLGRLSYNCNKANDLLAGLINTIKTHLGVANGFAILDANGQIPYSALPESSLQYMGNWDANTNTPTLADGTGTAGQFYIVSVAGTQDLGHGDITFDVNDRVIYGTDGKWGLLSSGYIKSVNNVLPVDMNVTIKGSDITVSNSDSRTVAQAIEDSTEAQKIVNNVTVETTDWVDESGQGGTPTYADYPFRADITVTDMTGDYSPDVRFGYDEMNSGIFAPVAESDTDVIKIYASQVPSADIVIPTIICTKLGVI